MKINKYHYVCIFCDDWRRLTAKLILRAMCWEVLNVLGWAMEYWGRGVTKQLKDIKSYTKIYKLSRWKFQILIGVCSKFSYYNPLCSYQKHVHTEGFLGVFRSWSRQLYIFWSGGGDCNLLNPNNNCISLPGL